MFIPRSFHVRVLACWQVGCSNDNGSFLGEPIYFTAASTYESGGNDEKRGCDEHQASLQNYDDPSKGYPWTRLGYPYDWGNLESEVGLSEFVIAASSTVAVENVYSTEEY